MGQAKQRGTYEQRKAQGIVRRAAEEQARLERHREARRESDRRRAEQREQRLAEMSPADRNKARSRSRAVGVVQASAGAIGLIAAERDLSDRFPVFIDEYSMGPEAGWELAKDRRTRG